MRHPREIDGRGFGLRAEAFFLRLGFRPRLMRWTGSWLSFQYVWSANQLSVDNLPLADVSSS